MVLQTKAPSIGNVTVVLSNISVDPNDSIGSVDGSSNQENTAPVHNGTTCR